MKVIIDTDLARVPGAAVVDNVTGIVASSEDANFPATNLLNDYPTDLWKAASGVHQATLAVSVSKGEAIEVYNTNALNVVVSVRTGENMELETGFALETGFELVTDEYNATSVYSLPGYNGRLWADYDEMTAPHTVYITLTAAAGETVYAGIVRAGVVEEFRDPHYGLDEDSVDYSIEKELNSGSTYARKRNVVRTFNSLSTIETRANCHAFKHDIWDLVGPKPLAVRLVHELITDWEFVLFAKRNSPPKIVHDVSSTHSRINFSLKEVV